MDSEGHIRLFQKIAVPYAWLFGPIANAYTDLVGSHLDDLSLPTAGTILDVGSGTGAFGYAFKKHGFKVHGVDGAPSMVATTEKHGIPCTLADGSKGLPFRDNSFELVTAAFVVHGLRKPDRTALLQEMARVSRKNVLIHDYSPASLGGKLSYVRLLELIERSDFKEFRRAALTEMRELFKRVQIIHYHSRFCWYLCS